ncbi:hypothetical protein SRHO_G00015560 [Serrasalmus rhombeus]
MFSELRLLRSAQVMSSPARGSFHTGSLTLKLIERTEGTSPGLVFSSGPSPLSSSQQRQLTVDIDRPLSDISSEPSSLLRAQPTRFHSSSQAPPPFIAHCQSGSSQARSEM